VVRRLARIVFALWLLRWGLRVLAARAGGQWLPPGPPPVDSPVQPGVMPLRGREEGPNE
jgi:hypothetical protein